MPAWEDFVREHFPGYLLPESARHALPAEEAARFVERLTGRPHELALLRAASTLSPRMELLHDFCFRQLAALVRILPSQTETLRREWDGGFHGRLDLRATLAHWSTGQETRFVTRSRRRSFALPENVLVRAVAERLLRVLVDLRQAGALRESGWGTGGQACEGQLRALIASTALKDVPLERLTARHEEAAHLARHPSYGGALSWHRWLRAGIDDDDPAKVAEVVANGALTPMSDATRFELAVVIRLVQALWARLSERSKGWRHERCLVRSDRREVASFGRDDGASVHVYYNQSQLDAGLADLGAQHYLRNQGRMRPDITVVVKNGDHESAAVIEVKLTDDRRYLLQGYHEAVLYRWEYQERLRGWPKAILVASSSISGEVRQEDDVVAIGWEHWIPEAVVDGLLADCRLQSS